MYLAFGVVVHSLFGVSDVSGVLGGASVVSWILDTRQVPEAPPEPAPVGDPALDQAREARAERRAETDRHLTLVRAQFVECSGANSGGSEGVSGRSQGVVITHW